MFESFFATHMAMYPFPLSVPTLCITKKEYEVKKKFNIVCDHFPLYLGMYSFFDFFSKNKEKNVLSVRNKWFNHDTSGDNEKAILPFF